LAEAQAVSIGRFSRHAHPRYRRSGSLRRMARVLRPECAHPSALPTGDRDMRYPIPL